MAAIFQKVILLSVLLSAVALILLSSYFFRIDSTDYRSVNYTANTGELTGNALVGQTFVASTDYLSGISLMFATYSGRDNTHPVIFGLREFGADGPEVRSVAVNAGRLGDNQLYKFAFTPIESAKGKTYFFYVMSPNSVPGNAVTVDLDAKDPYHQGSAYLGRSGKPQADVTFATHYRIPLAKFVSNKLASTVRYIIGSWGKNVANYMLYAIAATQAFLFFGLALAAFVAFGKQANKLMSFSTMTAPNPSFLKRGKPHSGIMLFLSALLVLAFIIRFWYAAEMPITYDEGNYLYDAKTLLTGRLAGGDGYVKAPLFILWVALWELLGGQSIIIGRLSSVIIGSLTLFPIYVIGRALWGRRAGITAAVAWSLLGVTTVFSVYIHTQSLAIFFGTTGVALTLRTLLSGRQMARNSLSPPGWLFMAGILFGLGVISRKSVLALGLIPLFLILFQPLTSWRIRLKSLAVLGAGFLIIIALFLLWAGGVYGAEGIKEAIGINSAEDGVSAVEESQREQVRAYSIRGVTPFFRESLPLIFLALLGLGISLERWLGSRLIKLSGEQRDARIRVFAKIAWLLPLILFRQAWLFFLEHEGSGFFLFGMTDLWWAMAATILIVALFTFDRTARSNSNKRRLLFGVAVPILWFGGLVLFYANWIKFHANYIGEFLPPLVLLAGLSLPAVWQRIKVSPLGKNGFVWKTGQVTIFLGLTMVVLWAAYASNFITYVYEHTGTYSQQAVVNAADWARQNIPPEEQIFTGAAVVPYVSGHKVALDIAHPRWYAYEFTRKNPLRLETFLPSAEEMMQAYRQANWFLLDEQTSFSFLMEYGEIEAGLLHDWQRVQGIENGSNTLTFYQRVISN